MHLSKCSPAHAIAVGCVLENFGPKNDVSLMIFAKKLWVKIFVRCGASFHIEIVSEKFEGKRLLERHRMVNNALAEQMKNIHSLSIKKALTPAQWKPEEEREARKE